MSSFKPAYLIHGDDHGRIGERRARLRALAEQDAGAGSLEVLEGADENHIVLAAEITVETIDFSRLEPMVAATLRELDQAGVSEKPWVALADAGFWNERHMDQVTAEHHIEVLIPPDSSKRNGSRRGWTGGRYAWMRSVAGDEQLRHASNAAERRAHIGVQLVGQAGRSLGFAQPVASGAPSSARKDRAQRFTSWPRR